jgi:hypothetical protein
MRVRQMSWAVLAVLAAAGMVLSFLDACNNGELPPQVQDACVPGRSTSCVGMNGCAGERQCGGTPAGLGSCECRSMPPADAAAKPSLGATCNKNSDCPSGAFCLDAHSKAFFGGAPPEGTCVADCSTGASACQHFANAVCVTTDATGSFGSAPKAALCFEACSLGATSETKCHGRTHTACAPVEGAPAGNAFCRPLCANNDECESAACDPAHGVCTQDKATDRTFGLRCGPVSDSAGEHDAGSDLDGGSDHLTGPICDGLCVQLNSAPSLCSRRCVFGGAHECAPASGGLRRGGCLFVATGGSIGDLGYCGELCDCSGDCIESSFVCDPFKDSSLERAFGRRGVCTDKSLALNEPLPCTK